MRRLLFALLVLTACANPAEPVVGDPPHHWEIIFDDTRVAGYYLYCTNGSHEPRTSEEAADAQAWFADQFVQRRP